MITVNVSDGLLTTSEDFLVTVNPADDPPAVSITPQTLAYRIGSKQILALDSAATITDVDTPTINFSGSVLKVSGQSAKDQLSLLKQGGILRKGKNVLFNGTAIGTLAGGKKGVALTVNLNDSATQPGVQALLRAIGFKSIDKVAGNRTLQIQITNLGGQNTVPATRQIQVGP